MLSTIPDIQKKYDWANELKCLHESTMMEAIDMYERVPEYHVFRATETTYYVKKKEYKNYELFQFHDTYHWTRHRIPRFQRTRLVTIITKNGLTYLTCSCHKFKQHLGKPCVHIICVKQTPPNLIDFPTR